VDFLKRTLGNGLGRLYGTGCEGLTIAVGLNMFGKLGAGSKERISGSIPLETGTIKIVTKYRQKS
jgi:hypothetical protein